MKNWINGVMESMGYPGVALLMFLENIFPPIPSELIMPAAGFAANNGRLTLVGVIASGIIGSVAGQLPLYYIGRKFGLRRSKRLADRYGRWLMISSHSIERAHRRFHRHGSMTVFVCRVIPGLRSLISIPAGVAKMNLAVFLIWTTAGTAIWTSVLAALGLWLGRNYDRVSTYLGPISTGVLVLVILAAVVWAFRRRRRVKSGRHRAHA